MERFIYTVLLTLFRQKDCGIAVGVPHHRAIEFYSDDMEITRNYLLQMLAMSGLTGLLVRRLFALSNGNSNYIPPLPPYVKSRFMMRIFSSHHESMKFTLQPSSLGLVSRYTRVFKYSHFYKVLIVGNGSGDVFIIFDNGRRIIHRMPRYITDVNILNSDLVVVCTADINAYVMRITPQNTLTLVVVLTHSKDVNYACCQPGSGLIATGSRDKTMKVWKLDAQKKSAICLQTLEINSPSVAKMMFHNRLPLLAFSNCDGKIWLYLLSPDGTEVLSRKILQGHCEEATNFVFHPDPKKTLLVSSGVNGRIIVWRFEINPSYEISTKYLVIDLLGLVGYWTCSISIHSSLPIVLIGFSDDPYRSEKNCTKAIFFSPQFDKLGPIIGMGEGTTGGSVKPIFDGENNVLCPIYNQQQLWEIVPAKK